MTNTNQSGWIKIANGSFGSRNGQPWSRGLAVANVRAKPSDTAAGLHGAFVAPSKDAIRAAIASQTCPWCGRGPFRRLALHTNKEHGVSGIELRDLAGLPRGSSICSPESSAASRSALLERSDRMEITMRGGAAGRAIATATARELSASRYEEEQRDRDEEIIMAVSGGQHRKQVAKDFSVTYATVLRILKRNGVSDDGRKDRGEERRGVVPPAARAGIERRQAQRLNDRKARWAELGEDHAALVQLATELNTSHKTLREYFKNAGITVPDGRK